MPIDMPFLIGISGGSGSGKTFILKRLLNHFSPKEISLISQDHYYLPLENQKRDHTGEYNFDEPEGIDEEGLYNDICLLREGKSIKKWEYTFNNPAFQPRLMEIFPAQILVIEGLFIFHFTRIAQMLDLKVFIHSDEAVCLKRRISRDWNERALKKEQVLYQWVNHVKPAYRNYLLPFINTCDYVLENPGGAPDLDPLFDLIKQRIVQFK